MPVLSVASDTAMASLAAKTAALVSGLSGIGALTEDQPPFLMTKIDLDLIMEFTNEGERNLRESSGPLLILTSGEVSIAQLAAVMDGLVWDATPAVGGVPLQEVQNQQGRIILIVKPELDPVVKELVAATYGRIARYRYTGDPKQLGGSWTFPENTGWQWIWYNHTNAIVDASAIADGYFRHWGKWL